MATYTVGTTGSGATYICDGTTDQTEINQALAAANGNPGSTVQMLAGTYNITGQILIGNSTTFTGNTASPTAAKLKVPNSGAGAFPDGTAIIEHLGSGVATSVEISYMEIDGNCVNQSTTLGFAHGVRSSSGSGVERCIEFAGGSGSYPKATDINIHHMYFHDAFGEAIHIFYAQNIRFHHNSCYNMQHDAIFLIECTGSGNEINNNIIEGITDGCIRLDNCTDFKIHDNALSPYHGPNVNGAYDNGANGMQIANEGNKVTKTNNLEIYNNTFTDIDLTGIWFNDVLGTAGTAPQTVHLYNNTFRNCGYTAGSGVNYGSGITINGWGNGLTIEYNTFDGCYQNAIQVLKAIGTANYTAIIKNNNIINTRGAGHSPGGTLSASYKGYGLLNLIPTRITAVMTGNYFSGNLTGKYYPTNLSSTSEATVLNGLRPGSEPTGDPGGTGGTVPPPTSTIPVRYIPGVRTTTPDWVFADYYILNTDGSAHTSYVNGWPLNIISYAPDTSKVIAMNKSPSIDGWNIGDFGFEGSTATIVCGESSLTDAWASISAWYSRAPAILELGDVFSEYFLECVPGKHSAVVRKDQGDIPAEYYEYSITVKTTIPHFQSIVKRIRSRLLTGSMNWSSDDTQPGNQLRNGEFNEWTPNTNVTWTTQTSLAALSWWDVVYAADTLTKWYSSSCTISVETGRLKITSGAPSSYILRLVTLDLSAKDIITFQIQGTAGYTGVLALYCNHDAAFRIYAYTLTGNLDTVVLTIDNPVEEVGTFNPSDITDIGFDGFLAPESTGYIDNIVANTDAGNSPRIIDNCDGMGAFVAVAGSGTDNRIMVSDGFGSWSIPAGLSDAANRNNDWRCCTWVTPSTNLPTGRFIAFSTSGTGNRVITSDDLITFTARTSAADNSWGTACYIPPNETLENGRVIAVAYAGTNRVMYSDDFGVTWTAVASAIEGNNWLSVCYSEIIGRLVAVAYTGTAGQQVMTSDNYGATWTARTTPTPNQYWTEVIRASALGLFIACSEDGTQQIMTSPTGETWTLQTTPYGSSTQTGGGTVLTTTTYTTPVGGYSSAATAYVNNSTSKEFEVVLPALTGGSVYRIDQVSCQLKTALAGTTASLKVTIQAASLYSGVETQIAEWTNTTTSYVQKTLSLALNSATGETVTLRYYLKTSNATYRAYTTVMGYIVTVATSGGSSITYTRNQWRGLVMSPTTDLIVAVAQSGDGNRVMFSTNGTDWQNSVSAANNNWKSITCSDSIFLAVGTTGDRVMISSDYGTIENVPPTKWTFINAGQKKGSDYMGEGSTGVLITGDGVTADIGGIYQPVNCDAGVTYVLTAIAKTIGLTQGSLVVEIFSGGSSIRQLVWDADADPEYQQITVKYDVSPLDPVIKIHGVGTPNSGALLYCDNVRFDKYSDFELSTVGNDIITYGNENTIPDIEVRSAIPQTNNTDDIVGAQIIYDSGVTSYTSASPYYKTDATSLELTVVIPATAGSRNRLDEVFCSLSNVHAGTLSYMAVNVLSASLFAGVETRVAEWTNSTTTLTKRIKTVSLLSGINESITLKYFLKTTNIAYRAVASHMGYKFTPTSTHSTSSDTNSLSVYNAADPSTVIDVCNLLPYGCVILINADYTGSFEYSTNFEDDSILSAIEEHVGATYSPTNRTLTIIAGGAIRFKFDSKFPVTGMPFIQTLVVSGTAQFSISLDGSAYYAITGDTTTDLIDTVIYRELDSQGNVSLVGNTVYYVLIQPKPGGPVVLGSIFHRSDLVTIDAPRPKMFATGKPNTFTSVLSGNPVICTLKTRDRNLVI